MIYSHMRYNMFPLASICIRYRESYVANACDYNATNYQPLIPKDIGFGFSILCNCLMINNTLCTFIVTIMHQIKIIYVNKARE